MKELCSLGTNKSNNNEINIAKYNTMYALFTLVGFFFYFIATCLQEQEVRKGAEKNEALLPHIEELETAISRIKEML
jgi:hypothetical protein